MVTEPLLGNEDEVSDVSIAAYHPHPVVLGAGTVLVRSPRSSTPKTGVPHREPISRQALYRYLLTSSSSACASPLARAAQGSAAQRRGCAARQDSCCRGLPLAQTTRSVSMRLRWCRASAPADCCPIRPMAIIGQRGGQRSAG